MFRYFNAILAVAALVGIGWLLSLPDKAECVASGRRVDPTERHCEATTGYQQLQEHALFHSREVLLVTAVVWGGAYWLHRRQRRRAG